MDDILTVAELIEELHTMPPEAKVMVPVIKYPGEFELKRIEGEDEPEYRWDLGTDVEVVPLERGDLLLKDGQCWMVVELAEFNEERATLNGAQAGPEDG